MCFTHILVAFRFLCVVALVLFVTFATIVQFMVIRFRIRAYRSPLRNVPGPRKTHWLKGNFPDVQEGDALRLQEEWVKTYGHVLKYYTFLGVRFPFPLSMSLDYNPILIIWSFSVHQTLGRRSRCDFTRSSKQ